MLNTQRRIYLITVLAALLAGAAAYGVRMLYESGHVRFNYPSTLRFPIRGIDISHHQGKIDWQALGEEQLQFIYIKASEGGDHKDRHFKANWDNAARHGMVRGAYHFFTFCKDGKSQALNYINTVPVEEHMLPPVIDIEYAGNCKTRPESKALLAELRNFAVEVERTYQRRPVFYVTEEIYADYLRGTINDYPLWIRDIYFEPRFTDRGEWLFWQFANRGRVKGINGPVDLNVFNGNKEAFELLLKPATS